MSADFTLHYVREGALPRFLAGAGPVLGVIGFGAGWPAGLAAAPFLQAPLRQAEGEPIFEVWAARNEVRPLRAGGVFGAYNDDVTFGATILPANGLQAGTELAYQEIFDFLVQAGGKTPIRFWNYLTDITGDDSGLERYRHFNIGRHNAFAARLAERLPPAASGVGGHAGDSIVYFLGAREAARPVENPRQVSAFDYPEVYGPRSPSFSRGSVHGAAVFISGTASIVGHESRHEGDLAGQIAETAENLRAVMRAADAGEGSWAVKVYLRQPADLAAVAPAVDEVFGADAQRVYLHGDICRGDLLLEIEAYRQ